MKNELVALPSGVEGAGLIAWWDLSGRVHPEMLAEALADEGLDLKPPVTTPANALKQAVGKVVGRAASRAHGVIAIKSSRDSWFLVERRLLDDGRDVALAAFARVEVDGENFVAIAMDRPGPMELADRVVATARALIDSTASWSISAWLCRVHTGALAGVSLRGAGGFYYIPPAARETFAAFWRAVGYVSDHRVSTIDALPTQETVAAVSEALRREYTSALEELQAHVASGVSMTAKGRASRIERLDELRAKLGTYASLLGDATRHLDEVVEEGYALVALS